MQSEQTIQSRKEDKGSAPAVTPEIKQKKEGVELAKDPIFQLINQRSKDTGEDEELNGLKRKREEIEDSEQSKKHLKVIDLNKLTATPHNHADVEDLLMSDEDDPLEKDAGPEEENLNELGLENTSDEVETDTDAKQGQETEVLSIQDQLLQMQDLSSEEDEDEDANDRLKEFLGEDLGEEESEDLDHDEISQ